MMDIERKLTRFTADSTLFSRFIIYPHAGREQKAIPDWPPVARPSSE
jgi:hypothetical protein